MAGAEAAEGEAAVVWEVRKNGVMATVKVVDEAKKIVAAAVAEGVGVSRCAVTEWWRRR